MITTTNPPNQPRRNRRPKPSKTQLIPAVRSEISQIVRRQMDRNIEEKYFQVSILYQSTATTSVTPPATAQLLSVDGMVQGTDSGQRIGDTVRIKKAILNLACLQNGGAVVIGPTYLSVYIARSRSTPTTVPSTANYQALKQSFNTPGTYSMEQSDQPNSFYTFVNDQQWEVAHHSNHLIGLAQPSVASGLGTNNDAVVYSSIKVDLTSRYPGKCRFNNNTALNNCWYIFAFAYEIQSAPTVSAVYPLIRGTINFVYEDA